MKKVVPNLTSHFDALKFCASNEHLSAAIEPDDLARAQEVCDLPLPVRVEISGSIDAHERAKLHIAVSGDGVVACQRCTRDFAISLTSKATLWIAASERQVEELEATTPQEDDVILSKEIENALQLVEDQILLSIPFSPRCNLPDCAAQATEFSE